MDDFAILAISVAAMLIVGFIGHCVGYDAGYEQAREDRKLYDTIDKSKWAKLEDEK